MTRQLRWSVAGCLTLVALIALAGCSHYMFAERDSWRHDAELACLNSGAVKDAPQRVRISAINGPGVCGMDYPLRVSALGESAPMSYTDEPPVPPSAIPNASIPQHWPVIQSNALPPLQSSALPPPPAYTPAPPQTYAPPPPQTYAPPQYSQSSPGGSQPGAPLSLNPTGIPQYGSDGDPGAPPQPEPSYSSPYGVSPAPLGPPSGPVVTASAGPVEVKPPATLACPIISRLDQWISDAIQPAAQKWFRQPVVEIKQISAYSCRGMNGDPNAHISEHAFGNALDIAEFTLADSHKISVQYGWQGTPEEQGFLHDVQSAACQDFTTVLAPGANVYHYNHIHVDLMRHYNGRHICEPTAISGEVAAERAREHYAARHSDPAVTGSIAVKHRHVLGYSGEDDDSLPLAVPGDD